MKEGKEQAFDFKFCERGKLQKDIIRRENESDAQDREAQVELAMELSILS